jgi:hypothetical protein
MNVNCIIDWERYHENRNTGKIKYNIDFKPKTVKQLLSEMDFRKNQMLILAFCKPTIIENLYMDFYEKFYLINGNKFSTTEINFKENWDLLMYAVECIEKFGFYSKIHKLSDVDSHIMWFTKSGSENQYTNSVPCDTKKQAIYEAVLEFCKNYVEENREKIIENDGNL